MAKTASGKRAKIIHEYLGYIRQLGVGSSRNAVSDGR